MNKVILCGRLIKDADIRANGDMTIAKFTLAVDRRYKKDEEKKERLGTVLYNLLEGIRILSVLIAPIMPETTKKIAEQLGYTAEDLKFETLAKFGHLTDVKVAKGEVIFPRIDAAKELAAIAKEEEEKKAAREAAKAKEEAPVVEEEKVEEINNQINSKLSDFERKVLKYYVEGYNYIEISQKLEKEPKSVDNALNRIKIKLRNLKN